jgi:hypothetical protein
MAAISRVSRFSIEPLKSSVANYATTSALLASGTNTGLVLNGDTLRDQFGIGNNYLVVTDTLYLYYDNSLHFYYLDDAYKVLEYLWFGTPYMGGTLRNVQVVPPSEVEFSFFDSDADRWRLKILSDAEYLAAVRAREQGMLNFINRFVIRFKAYKKASYFELVQIEPKRSNPALDSDTYSAPLRAPVSARQRER